MNKMFEQLLAHIVGDYIIQTNKMSIYKAKSIPWALLHGFTYSLAFIFMAHPMALFVIFITHAVIDRYLIACWGVHNYLLGMFSKRTLLDFYPNGIPPYLTFWLIVLLDNSLHILINYLSILYLN